MNLHWESADNSLICSANSSGTFHPCFYNCTCDVCTQSIQQNELCNQKSTQVSRQVERCYYTIQYLVLCPLLQDLALEMRQSRKPAKVCIDFCSKWGTIYESYAGNALFVRNMTCLELEHIKLRYILNSVCNYIHRFKFIQKDLWIFETQRRFWVRILECVCFYIGVLESSKPTYNNLTFYIVQIYNISTSLYFN